MATSVSHLQWRKRVVSGPRGTECIFHSVKAFSSVLRGINMLTRYSICDVQCLPTEMSS